MIDYSLSLLKNPMNRDAAPKAYAKPQVRNTLTLEDFAQHISEHHSKYGKGDIQCILSEMVTCMREQLLLGNKVQLGEMGSFYVAFRCKGADTMADFNTSVNIKKVVANWVRGAKFKNLKEDASYQEVLTRKEQAEAIANK